MKKRNLIMYSVLILFIFSCGESEQDKSNRIELSAIIRQLNTAYSDLKENQKAEENLNLLKTRDYYAEYIKQFRQLRNELARKPITPKFSNVSAQLDLILVKSTRYINLRQRSMLGLFELNNRFSRYLNYMKDAEKYKSKTYGREYYADYLTKALDRAAEFGKNKIVLSRTFNEQDSLVGDLISQSDNLNTHLKELNFIDTLNFNFVLTDTSNIVFEGWRAINSISADELMDRIDKSLGVK